MNEDNWWWDEPKPIDTPYLKSLEGGEIVHKVNVRLNTKYKKYEPWLDEEQKDDLKNREKRKK